MRDRALVDQAALLLEVLHDVLVCRLDVDALVLGDLGREPSRLGKDIILKFFVFF